MKTLDRYRKDIICISYYTLAQMTPNTPNIVLDKVFYGGKKGGLELKIFDNIKTFELYRADIHTSSFGC